MVEDALIDVRHALRRRREKIDPFTSGRLSFERGEPLNADFGTSCAGWPPISAQCLYELGRLKSASLAARATAVPKPQVKPRRGQARAARA